jgi:hypothetical protein
VRRDAAACRDTDEYSAFAVALQGRAARYFLCLGKESNQRKPRPRIRRLRRCPVLLGDFEGINPSRYRLGDAAGPLEDAAAVLGGSGALPGACLSPWRGAAAIGRVSRTAR